jgi:hypothetical protein
MHSLHSYNHHVFSCHQHVHCALQQLQFLLVVDIVIAHYNCYINVCSIINQLGVVATCMNLIRTYTIPKDCNLTFSNSTCFGNSPLFFFCLLRIFHFCIHIPCLLKFPFNEFYPKVLKKRNNGLVYCLKGVIYWDFWWVGFNFIYNFIFFIAMHIVKVYSF